MLSFRCVGSDLRNHTARLRQQTPIHVSDSIDIGPARQKQWFVGHPEKLTGQQWLEFFSFIPGSKQVQKLPPYSVGRLQKLNQKSGRFIYSSLNHGHRRVGSDLYNP